MEVPQFISEFLGLISHFAGLGFSLALMLILAFSLVYAIFWFGAYKQAAIWKHPDRPLHDTARYLVRASVPAFLGFIAAISLIWLVPSWLQLASGDGDLKQYQVVASITVWIVSQIYWWGWVVERIRRPPT
jgi:hypothetical protein